MASQPKLPRPQPQVIFFDLEIGSLKNIHTKKTQKLDIPVSFSFTHELGGLGTFEMVFNDLTGKKVANKIVDTDKPIGYVQFGYEGDEPLKSPRISFVPTKLVPSFGPNCFSISFGGMVLGPMALQTGLTSGTFQENVTLLSDKYKEQLPYFKGIRIDPPIDAGQMKEIGTFDKDTTVPQEFQFMKHASEVDWNFLLRLCKYAKDADGNSGYVLVPKNIKDEECELLITIPGKGSDVKKYGYTYPSREGNVIDFIPDIDYVSFVRGAIRTGHGMETITGNLKKHVMDPGSTKPAKAWPHTMDNPPGLVPAEEANHVKLSTDQGEADANENTTYRGAQHPDVSGKDGGGVRALPLPTTTAMAGINPTIYEQLYCQMVQQTAVLVLLGDPTIEPGMKIDIEAFFPNNYDEESGDGTERHPSTGTYIASQVRHTIDTGGYRTTVQMFRISPKGQLEGE